MNFDFRDTRSGEASFSAHRSYFLTLPRDWIVKTWKNENLFHLRPPFSSGDEKFKMTAFHVRIIYWWKWEDVYFHILRDIMYTYMFVITIKWQSSMENVFNIIIF